MKKSKKRIALLIILGFVIIGFLIPQHLTMPVVSAGRKNYDQQSFWAYPWGKSVTHKGVDIFAREGTLINSATVGIVIYAGQNDMGGNVVFVLGPQWRIHYYAHLREIKTSFFSIVNHNDVLGTVGATGNAKGKPPHLHYTIQTIFPYFWQMDDSRQGWKKMIYLNPIPYLNNSINH